MSKNFFLILTENINPTQRRLLQALVKRKGKNWWHEFVDAWIVEGGDIAQWTQDVNIIINGQKGDQAIILSLPSWSGDRRAGVIIPVDKRKWFRDVYAAREERGEIESGSRDTTAEEEPS